MGDQLTTSSRARRVSWVVAAALATVLAGCVGPDPLGGLASSRNDAPPPAATTCGADSYSCILPFPSDRWQIADPTTATGVRLEVPPNAVDPAVLAKLGPRDEVREALLGADGFSPLTPVVFQLPEALAPSSIPADGGDLVAVWDVTTGARVPIRAEVSQFRADERGAHNIVLAWPRTKFEYGHQIFGRVGRGVVDAAGGAATASPSLESASAATREAAVVDTAADWPDYLSATSFVVRTEQSIVADVDRLAGILRSEDHPVRYLKVLPSLLGGAAVVEGQLRSTDFREADGVIPRDGSATPRERWLDFTLVVPDHGASPDGAPVVMYGHGITAFKESMLVVSGQNASKGYATIGIDLPNHGTRVPDGGHIVELAQPNQLGRVESSLLQGELDQLSLLLAIPHLADLDVLPRDWLANTGGDGVGELDTSHVLYQGTSLGGVLGGTFLALAPEIEAAFLQVPGSGIIDTLVHSLVWELFKNIVPGGAPLGETHVLTFFAQTLLDRADNTYYLDRIRRRGTPVYVSYAIDDGVVPNFSTERMLALLDLPMTGKRWGPVGLGLDADWTAAMPADGRAFSQVPTDELYGNVLKPFLTHLEFLNPVSVSALDLWLDDRTDAVRASATE